MTGESTTETVSERALVDAKLTLDEAIEEFTRSQRLGEESVLVASERLHSAVIGLWWRMRPHLREDEGWDDVEEIEDIEGDTIFSGVHPKIGREVEISGLKDLEEWIDKKATMHQDQSSPNTSSRTSEHTITVRLPADAAIKAAKALSNRFHEYGWDAQASQGLPGQDEFDPAGEDLKRKDKQEIL